MLSKKEKILSWPSTIWFSVAHALTMCTILLEPYSQVPHIPFPSMLTTSLPVSSATERVQAMKEDSNSSGFRAKNTRLNVSWEGMPAGRRRKVRSHSCLALPKFSMSFQISAPQITEAMAMKRMSSNIWALVRSTRGSVNSEKKGNGLFIVFSKDRDFRRVRKV